MRMRFSLVVRASDCQCTSCNGPGFDPSIRRHRGIWGAADEAVLNIVRKKEKKIPKKIFKKKTHEISYLNKSFPWYSQRRITKQFTTCMGKFWKHPKKTSKTIVCGSVSYVLNEFLAKNRDFHRRNTTCRNCPDIGQLCRRAQINFGGLTPYLTYVCTLQQPFIYIRIVQ